VELARIQAIASSTLCPGKAIALLLVASHIPNANMADCLIFMTSPQETSVQLASISQYRQFQCKSKQKAAFYLCWPQGSLQDIFCRHSCCTNFVLLQ
jgi:hypothetical protein